MTLCHKMKEGNGNELDSLSYFDVFIVESSTTSANEENVERDEDGEIIALYDKVTKNKVKSRKAGGEKLMMGLKQTKRQDDNLLALIKEENVYICDDVVTTVKEVSQYQSPVHATKKSAKRTKSDNIQPMLNIVKETLNGREDKILFCKICGKSFLYSWERDQHKCKIHPEQVSYRCDLCNATFMFRSSLDEHLLSHTTDKMVSCDKCSAKFKDLKSLERHLQQNHKGDRYPCKVCGKAFPYQWELKMHQMKKHTGERPFVCEVCGASFFVRSALGRHMKLHTGDRPFKCSYCAKTFTLRGHLNAHIRTHTGERPFMCHYCGTSYMKSADLLYHLRTHTGERPFKCATCGLAYFRPEHLRRHKTVHTGGDYTCNVCGAKFTRATTLRCHQKKIHGMVATAESGYQ